MKLRLTIVLNVCICISFIGCSKDTNNPPEKSDDFKNLIGNWQWSMSKTGWGATLQPGIDTVIVLSFSGDSTYSINLNNQVKYTGHFSTESSQSPGKINSISFETNLDVGKLKLYKKENITGISNDTLSLYDDNIADGSVHHFTLKK